MKCKTTVKLMRTLHGKGSTDSGNSDSTSYSVICHSGLEIFVYINRILTKLWRWKLGGLVIISHHVDAVLNVPVHAAALCSLQDYVIVGEICESEPVLSGSTAWALPACWRQLMAAQKSCKWVGFSMWLNRRSCLIVILSLIHIWRCRRSTLCRSRWSPYH